MSRSGYVESLDEKAMNCWRGAVRAAIRGRRGQAFLREMLAALDAMPEKRLIHGDLVREDGEVCAIGSVFKARGLDVKGIDPYDYSTVAGKAGVAEAMAREIEYENDEGTWRDETPQKRWERMRRWVEKQIQPARGEQKSGKGTE